jgi:hypothetical protein
VAGTAPPWGRFKVCFRRGGRQFHQTVKTTDRGAALAVGKRVEENIALVERRGARRGTAAGR